jgi:GT2 family glycosyltransferase
MASMRKVSIITVNYKQAALTCDFLRSITQHAQGEDVEVLVIDNGSEVDQEVYFQEVYPGVKYIRSERNLGFAGANNLGIAQATGDYLLFLNNDTEITEGYVGAMRREMDTRPEIGLLSSLILYFEDKTRIQYAGYTPMNYYTARNRGIGVMDSDQGQYNETTTSTGYAHGAAMMCRRADLDRVGLMPVHYFLYYEELDWCEQFRRAGLQCGFTGKAKIYHKESMSVGKESPLKAYFMARNRWLFIRRNASKEQALVFACYNLFIATPAAILRSLLRNRLDLVRATARGTWWNVTNPPTSTRLGIKLGDG